MPSKDEHQPICLLLSGCPILFPNPLSHFKHCVAKPVDGCQCCLCRVALTDTHGASDFFRNHHASEIVDPTDNSGCFHSCLQMGIFLGLVLLLVFSPHFIPCSIWKIKESSIPAFFISAATVRFIAFSFLIRSQQKSHLP